MSHAFPQLEMEPVYGFFHYLSTNLSELAFRGDTAGQENLPKSGSYLIAANHASHLDPFLIGSRIPRQMTFFARKTLKLFFLKQRLCGTIDGVYFDLCERRDGGQWEVGSVGC